MIIRNNCVASVMVGDCLESLRTMPDASVDCCVTSPPYFGLRDYGHEGQIGLEDTPDAFVARLVEVFREVRRVLADDGTLWLNIGDSYARNPSKGGSGPGGKNGAYSDTYTAANERRTAGAGVGQRAAQLTLRVSGAGIKEKDLIGIPWMLAFALRADGWYLRQEIIWHKPNPMPESVRDRCTKAHEQIFLLSKSPRYYYDHDAVKEPSVGETSGRRGDGSTSGAVRISGGLAVGCATHMGSSETRNRRSVWTVAPRPYAGAHFAVFPPELIEPCVLAGCRPGGVVLDPFGGSGTTAGVALRHGRNALMLELSPDYAALMPARVAAIVGAK